MAVHRNFQSLIRVLKKHCPAQYPVRVTSRKVKKDNGGVYLRKAKNGQKYFLVIIDDTILSHLKSATAKNCYDYCLYCSLKNMILLHEWAHVLSWDEKDLNQDDHSPIYGKSYSKVFRIYEKWVDGNL